MSESIPFDSVLFSSDRDLRSLSRFLDTIKSYRDFDYNQSVRVFCNRNKEFTALESIDFDFCYLSRVHKMQETIDSQYFIPPIPFSALYERVFDLASQKKPYPTTHSH